MRTSFLVDNGEIVHFGGVVLFSVATTGAIGWAAGAYAAGTASAIAGAVVGAIAGAIIGSTFALGSIPQPFVLLWAAIGLGGVAIAAAPLAGAAVAVIRVARRGVEPGVSAAASVLAGAAIGLLTGVIAVAAMGAVSILSSRATLARSPEWAKPFDLRDAIGWHDSQAPEEREAIVDGERYFWDQRCGWCRVEPRAQA